MDATGIRFSSNFVSLGSGTSCHVDATPEVSGNLPSALWWIDGLTPTAADLRGLVGFCL